MAQPIQSQSPTASLTPNAGDESAAKDKERINALKEAAKAAKAPDSLLQYMIGRGASVDEAQAAFDELNATGQWSNGKNSATFLKAKE